MPIRVRNIEKKSISSRVSLRQTVSILAFGSMLVTGGCVTTTMTVDSNKASTKAIPSSGTIPSMTATVSDTAGTIPSMTATMSDTAGTIPSMTATMSDSSR